MNEEINVVVYRPDVKSIFSQVPTGVDPSLAKKKIGSRRNNLEHPTI
jgi:hypothetical protein